MVDDARSSRVQNFEIHFIDVPPKEFDCPICLETLKNPFAIECCRHHFCDACINYAKGKKNECPLCKANPIKGALDNQFKRAINKASVYCSRRSEGCKWEGRFDSLNNHLSLGQLNGQCKHVMLNCPYMKCKISMSRHQMIDHVKACQYRPFACPHCGYEGAHAEIVKMHYEICSMYPLVCPNNCSQKTFKRGELPGHLDTCPNAMVCCPFVNLGCKVKTKRYILKRHIDSDGSQHGFLVSSAINDLHKENKLQKESLEVKVSVLGNKCSQLEKDFFAALNMYEQNEVKRDNFVASLFEQNSILESNLSSLYIKNAQLKNDLSTAYVDLKTSLSTRCSILEDQFGKLKNHLTSSIRQVAIREREIKNLYDNCLHKTNMLKKQINLLNCANVSLPDDVSCVDSSLRSRTDLTVDTSDEGNTALRTSLNILAAKHASLEEKVNNNIQDGTIVSNQERMMKLLQQLETKVEALQRPPGMQDINYWICGYKLMAETMKKCNWRLYLKTMAETATQFPDPVSPVIINVEGYERAKAFRMLLVTAPFFTGGSGKYKLQLLVRVNGYAIVDVAHGGSPVTFMSVHTCLLKGEFDDLLSWPFVGNITVSLLNQVENNHHHNKVIWDKPPTKYAGQVPPNQPSNWPWGQHTFISQVELESASPSKQYIMNDTLYFEVQATATPSYNIE